MVHHLEGLGERRHPRQGRCVPAQRGSPDTPRHCLPAGTRAPTPSLTLRCPPAQGLVATLHEGDDFGQLALVNDAPRAATIILREDNCHFLRVDKQDFNHILKVGRGGGHLAGCEPGHTVHPPWCSQGRILLCVPIRGFGVQASQAGIAWRIRAGLMVGFSL